MYLAENFDTLKCCLLTLHKNKEHCDIVDLLEKTFRIFKTPFWIVESLKQSSNCINLSNILLSISFHKDFDLEFGNTLNIEDVLTEKYLCEYQQLADQCDFIMNLFDRLETDTSFCSIMLFPPLQILKALHVLSQIWEFKEIQDDDEKIDIVLVYLKYSNSVVDQSLVNVTRQVFEENKIVPSPFSLLMSVFVQNLEGRLKKIQSFSKITQENFKLKIFQRMMFGPIDDINLIGPFILRQEMIMNFLNDPAYSVFPLQSLINLFVIYKDLINVSTLNMLLTRLLVNKWLFTYPYLCCYGTLAADYNVNQNLNLMRDRNDLVLISELFMILDHHLLTRILNSRHCKEIFCNLYLIALIPKTILQKLSIEELIDKSKLLELL